MSIILYNFWWESASKENTLKNKGIQIDEHSQPLNNSQHYFEKVEN